MTKAIEDRFIVKLQKKNIEGLIDTGRVAYQSDGRLKGISKAVNRALADYLERI